MDGLQEIILLGAGFFAGLIDSIAGGGGLITLPTLSMFVGAGPDAIGTNKIVGTMGALIAFLVYLRSQKLNIKNGLAFIVAISIGSSLGALVSPLLPKDAFRILLILACPLILVVVWNRQLLIQSPHPDAQKKPKISRVLLTGVGVGFYDGFFGPGGGTFMLLGLLSVVKLPLMEALLLSKLANTVSAGASLVTYAAQGYVHTRFGIVMAVGMTLGGFLGARFATKRAEKAVRPALLFVVLLLMVHQLIELMR